MTRDPVGGTSAPMDDPTAVTAVLEGDTAAFAMLYRAHVRAVSAAVRDNVHDPESVADVIQEVFLRALERLGALRDRNQFRPWLLAIARHAAIDHRRARGRSPVVDDVVAEPADTSVGPDLAAELDELAALIRTGLAELSTRDATALTMVTQLGFGAADIAACLGVSHGAAKVLLHRARGRLRDALALELLVRRRAGGCQSFDALFFAGDLVAAGRHVRACPSCSTIAQSEVTLYGGEIAARPGHRPAVGSSSPSIRTPPLLSTSRRASGSASGDQLEDSY
jgi:RNA polymerase sigma-70 factor (ECF subfamily)